MLKKILINILFIILFILLVELLSLLILGFKYKQNIFGSIKSGDNIVSYFMVKHFDSQNYDQNYRFPLIATPPHKQNTKKSILIFGCSFAYGDNLGYKENFSGQLYELTNFSIFNRAEGGTGPQIMFYQFDTEKVKQLTKDCDYIIYVYIPDHLRRVTMFRCWPFLYKISIRYKLDKNRILKLQKLSHILAYSNFYRLYESACPNIFGEEYSKELLYELIKQSYQKSQLFYPNSKFIILDYSYNNFELKKECEAIGIKVISLSDLTDQNLNQLKFQISEFDNHPNAEAWKLITPLFIEKAGIK